MKHFSNPIICACLLLIPTTFSSAQDSQIPQLKDSVRILSKILEEGLELDASPGYFGISGGRVENLYLQGQGVVLEIRAPLSNKRNRVSLNAMAAAISGLQSDSNTNNYVQRAYVNPADRRMALALEQDSTNSVYRELVEEIQAIDFSALIENSIRQANSTARSLRDLEQLDTDAFEKLQDELYKMRNDLSQVKQDMTTRVEELQAMQRNLAAGGDARDQQIEDIESGVRENIENMKEVVEGLRANAQGRATSLNQQYQSAKAQFDEQWAAQASELEANLYNLLCDYGATLKNLPEDENLTVVLKGFGNSVEDQLQSDKVHILSKADLSLCQSGSIDAASLQQRSSVYDY
jgi:hypothetical protein